MNCVFDSPTTKAFTQEPQRRTIFVDKQNIETGTFFTEIEVVDVPKVFFILKTRPQMTLYFGAIEEGHLRKITSNYISNFPATISRAFEYCLGKHKCITINETLDYFWNSTFQYYGEQWQPYPPEIYGGNPWRSYPQLVWKLEDLADLISRDI